MKNQTVRFRYGTVCKRLNTSKKTKHVNQKKKKSKCSCRTRLPSTNNVCRWWKQESLWFKLKAFSSRAQINQLERIHDEKVASIGPQKLTNIIEISQKWHQLEIQTTRFRFETILKRLKDSTSKKTRSVSQKTKKLNLVVEQSSLPQIQLKMIKPNFYFLYETWFFHFFHWFFLGKISVYDSLRFETKNIATSFVFLWGEIWFSDGVRLFLHQYQKILAAFFCGISAEIRAFR